MDEVGSTANFASIYLGSNLYYIATKAAHSLVEGKTYRFILKAINTFGSSDASEETRTALGVVPS